MAGLCPAFSLNGGWSFRCGPGLSISYHETLTAFPAHAIADELFRRIDCSWLQREGVDRMENLFLTTLLISVVIGVLIIYHVTPEG
jgi:hypothetical protein